MKLYYPAGWPLWRVAARSGMPIHIKVKVLFDSEAGVFVAYESTLPGLVAEAETVDQLIKNIDAAADDLLRSHVEGPHPRPVASYTFDNAAAA